MMGVGIESGSLAPNQSLQLTFAAARASSNATEFNTLGLTERTDLDDNRAITPRYSRLRKR